MLTLLAILVAPGRSLLGFDYRPARRDGDYRLRSGNFGLPVLVALSHRRVCSVTPPERGNYVAKNALSDRNTCDISTCDKNRRDN